MTDFLPTRFNGESIDSDLATAHFLAFSDYLEAHEFEIANRAQFLQHCNTARTG